MTWLGGALGLDRRPPSVEAAREQDEARKRLLDQERRIEALDRVVEVISRELPEDRPHAGA